MFGVKITDKYKHVYKYVNYQIIVGRNQIGNDHILDHYFFVKDRCYWFHLANSTSQHIILYLEDDIDKKELV
jgi:predicted ribosome quality control (RQC) complex YloA/Tae2 family protein